MKLACGHRRACAGKTPPGGDARVPSRRGPWQGTTLAEAVLASFILLSAFLVLFNLFHASMRYSTWVERQNTAALLAEKNMDRVRAWSEQVAGGIYNFDSDWSAYDGVTYPDPEDPGYRVSVYVEPGTRPLDSPCSRMEAPFAPDLRRLPEGVVPVEVQVSWDPLDPGKRVRLVSYIGEPPRRLRPASPLVITPVSAIPDPIPVDGQVTMEVKAYDSQDRELKNTTFHWTVQPVGTGATGLAGNGTVVTGGTRDGRRVVFENSYRNAAGVTVHTGGECVLRVRARCGADEATQDSVVLRLGL